MPILRKALVLLTSKEQRRGGLVLSMVIVMAVLGTPEVMQSNPVLNTVYEGLGITSVDASILALGASAFGLILFSAVFRSCRDVALALGDCTPIVGPV